MCDVVVCCIEDGPVCGRAARRSVGETELINGLLVSPLSAAAEGWIDERLHIPCINNNSRPFLGERNHQPPTPARKYGSHSLRQIGCKG